MVMGVFITHIACNKNISSLHILANGLKREQYLARIFGEVKEGEW